MFRKELPYVLTDCDGTITMPDFGIKPETKKDILKYQKKSGYHFSFITGRNAIVNKMIADELKIQLPIVSCNGGLISDPHTFEVLHAEYLDKEATIAAFREAQKLGIDMVCYEPEAIVGTPDSNRVQAWSQYNDALSNKKHKFNIKLFDDLDKIADAIADNYVKPVELIMLVETDEQEKTMKKLMKKFEKQLDIVQSLPHMFNAMKKGVNKEYGLIKWAEIVNTDYKDVITFGDNYNDMEMIKAVNHGYAVGNAVPELKKAAFKTVESVGDNGVGKQLERIMNNEY